MGKVHRVGTVAARTGAKAASATAARNRAGPLAGTVTPTRSTATRRGRNVSACIRSAPAPVWGCLIPRSIGEYMATLPSLTVNSIAVAYRLLPLAEKRQVTRMAVGSVVASRLRRELEAWNVTVAEQQQGRPPGFIVFIDAVPIVEDGHLDPDAIVPVTQETTEVL